MAYTLCTEAEALLAIGQNAGAAQILTANTTIWVNMAEGLISSEVDYDVVTNYASFTTWQKEVLKVAATSMAAMIGINQNQNSWQLATAQSKLNVLDYLYYKSIEQIRKFTA